MYICMLMENIVVVLYFQILQVSMYVHAWLQRETHKLLMSKMRYIHTYIYRFVCRYMQVKIFVVAGNYLNYALAKRA